MSSLQSWSIEYSHSSEKYHLGRTGEMLRRNLKSVTTNEQLDFICLGIFSSKGQAEDAMLELRRKRVSHRTIALF